MNHHSLKLISEGLEILVIFFFIDKMSEGLLGAPFAEQGHLVAEVCVKTPDRKLVMKTKDRRAAGDLGSFAIRGGFSIAVERTDRVRREWGGEGGGSRSGHISSAAGRKCRRDREFLFFLSQKEFLDCPTLKRKTKVQGFSGGLYRKRFSLSANPNGLT